LNLGSEYSGGMKEITRELEDREPCGALFDLVAGADLEALSEEQKTTLFVLARKLQGVLDHAQLAILSGFEDTTEVAIAAKEPEQSVVRQREGSGALERLPQFAGLLRRGEIDLRRLEAVDDRTVNLPTQEMISQVEDALVDLAPGLTRTQLARRVTRLVAEVDPLGYEQRCQKATKERRVGVTPPHPPASA